MTILYAKAGETQGWNWLMVKNLKTGEDISNVIECDVIKGFCVVATPNGPTEIEGRFKIWDRRH